MARPADVLDLIAKANSAAAAAPDLSPKMQDALRSGARLARDSRKELDVMAKASRVASALVLVRRAARREVSCPTPPRSLGRARRPACNQRTRGSRRTSSRAGPGGDDPGESDLDPEPPSLRLWRHETWGSCTPNLLHVLVGEGR